MDKQKPLTPNKRGYITAAYYASFVAMGISMASLGPTLPSLAANTRAGLAAISILFTARSLGALLGSVWGGQLYDRLRGHRVMALMILCMAIFTALTPFVSLLWLLVGVLFITGAVQGILNIGGNALLVWVHGKKVGPFMNGLHFFFGVGTFSRGTWYTIDTDATALSCAGWPPKNPVRTTSASARAANRGEIA